MGKASLALSVCILGEEVRSSAFNIRNFRRAIFFYVMGNGVDDSFDMEKGTAGNLYTCRWNINFKFKRRGGEQRKKFPPFFYLAIFIHVLKDYNAFLLALFSQ